MLGSGKSLSLETKFSPTAQLVKQRCTATVLARRVRSVYYRFAQNLSNIFEMSVAHNCEMTVIQKHVFSSRDKSVQEADGGCSKLPQQRLHLPSVLLIAKAT